MTLLNRSLLSKLKNNHEFLSSLVRLLIWCFACSHIFVTHYTGRLSGNIEYYLWTLAASLLIFIGLLISILIRPVWPGRLIVSMIVDISAITVCILPSEEAINLFTLVYLLGVVSYGARYGKKYLLYFAAGSALAYTSVITSQGLFTRQPTEAGFFLILLFALPIYQYMVINRRIAAEQATEVKNRFLSTMTHELRTPLSGVIGMSRLLDSTRLDNEQREYVKSIQSASDVLMSLIGDILDFSKIEAKRLEICKTSLDIRECVGAVCQLLSSRAEDKRLELICRIDEDVPSSIQSDEIRIKQILYNLIGNAIKFTELGEIEVWVSVTKELPIHSTNLEIKIRDTGPGIHEEKLKRIFEGFWQENLSVTRKHGGTGLGTTISLELARLLGGEVDVTSTQGVGSTFRVILPLDAGMMSPPPMSQKIISGKSFLVLEHNQSSFDVISDILSTAGAKDVCKQNTPGARDITAIILADNRVPMDLDTIAQSQIEAIGSDVPVLVLGYNSRKYNLSLPRWALLCKPFLPRQLKEKVSELLTNLPTLSETHAAIGSASEIAEKRATKILVAEDEPINAKLIRALLNKKGHESTLAKNGTQALKLLTEQHFDLAILDIRMPEMGGIEVTKRLRALEYLSGNYIPVVALTASAINDVRETCLKAGMDEFLLKPINPDLLDDLIVRFTNG